ncbi:hypothetical protein NEFER03_1413 [Nematocida sp. LUAm3]|nr:hypothetical protein NEFER03_1413 [Nematocida sp. LUAm3]
MKRLDTTEPEKIQRLEYSLIKWEALTKNTRQDWVKEHIMEKILEYSGMFKDWMDITIRNPSQSISERIKILIRELAKKKEEEQKKVNELNKREEEYQKRLNELKEEKKQTRKDNKLKKKEEEEEEEQRKENAWDKSEEDKTYNELKKENLINELKHLKIKNIKENVARVGGSKEIMSVEEGDLNDINEEWEEEKSNKKIMRILKELNKLYPNLDPIIDIERLNEIFK